jgi:hypothetical protein
MIPLAALLVLSGIGTKREKMAALLSPRKRRCARNAERHLHALDCTKSSCVFCAETQNAKRAGIIAQEKNWPDGSRTALTRRRQIGSREKYVSEMGAVIS